MYLNQINPEELQGAVTSKLPIIIPIGAVEFHGNHLPLGTDSMIVEEIIRRTEREEECVIAPMIFYGITGYQASGSKKGTMNISMDVYKNMFFQILCDFAGMGFEKIAIASQHQGSHGASATAVRFAYQEMISSIYKGKGMGWWTKESGKRIGVPDVRVLRARLGEGSGGLYGNGHAGILETSLIQAIRPDTVDMKKLMKDDYFFCWQEAREAYRANSNMGEECIKTSVNAWVEFLKEWKKA